MIKKDGDKDTHTNLPCFSNTSEIYFRKNTKGVCQARVYVEQKMFLDFDWSHNHTNNGDNRTFKRGTVHVQVWIRDTDGSFYRVNDNARLMNNTEMKRYGPILKTFCPTVKLR